MYLYIDLCTKVYNNFFTIIKNQIKQDPIQHMNDSKTILHADSWVLFSIEMVYLSLKNPKETFKILLSKEVNVKGFYSILLHYKTFWKRQKWRKF